MCVPYESIFPILCFAFLSKIQKLNMTPILGEEKFFGKLERVVTLQVENFNKIALYHTVKEIQAILCFTR